MLHTRDESTEGARQHRQGGEIKDLLASEDPLEFAERDTITTGQLTSSDGSQVPYRILLGWNLALANRCDDTWGTFNMSLMRYIKAQGYTPKQLDAVLAGIQIDDDHWRWLEKSLAGKDAAYKWFFLAAEGEPQAACLVYHPKPSAVDGQGIFYIEFLAVAPWNRHNPMSEQAFKGVGTAVIRAACVYAIEVLHLRPGFCLHAIPRAVGFYQSIGMTQYPAHDKGVMPYFEMPQNSPMLAELAP